MLLRDISSKWSKCGLARVCMMLSIMGQRLVLSGWLNAATQCWVNGGPATTTLTKRTQRSGHRKYETPIQCWVNVAQVYDAVPTLNPHSAGIDFSRQNLTSVDVRF